MLADIHRLLGTTNKQFSGPDGYWAQQDSDGPILIGRGLKATYVEPDFETAKRRLDEAFEASRRETDGEEEI